MKNMIPALLLVLALTGAASTLQTPSGRGESSNIASTLKTTALPIPTCPPDDPDACGNPPLI